MSSASAPAPLVIKGKLKQNIKVTFHGENHSSIDNRYYEALNIPASAVLLVEHSTNACELKPEEEHLFRRYAKGSEWVFYTQKKANNPNVICFDTRAEQGYLNAFQEKELRDIADTFHEANSDKVRLFLQGLVHSIHTFSENQDYYMSIPGYFEHSYDMLESQLKALMSLLKYRKAHPDSRTVLGMPLNDLLDGVANTLVNNIVKVASVSTDISLAKALEIFSQSKPSEIHVFCGKNHAIRMTDMVNLTSVKSTPIDASLRRSANIQLNGDPAMDRMLIEL